jgi:CubicO group peptidase (beta-lactamase class C family)
MQDSAYFAIDSKLTRNLKYYGGLNMSARDLAKFGVLMLHNGRFQGRTVVPRNWFRYCKTESHRSESDDRYCLGWYYSEDDAENDIYYAAGFNGQIMLINATRKVIVIRLGKDKGGVNWYPLLRKLSMQA